MGEFRPFRPSESRFVPCTDGMQRGNHWFKPQEAVERSAPSARVSRCSLRTADGVRGEAQRPLRVRNGFTWTGPVGYYPGVTSPGRVVSCGARLEA